MTPESAEFMGIVTGATTAGFFIIALFFVRFWRKTRDLLFLAFAGAFLLLAIAQPIPLMLGIPSETQAPVYLIRLAAFALIIAAVIRKNTGGGA